MSRPSSVAVWSWGRSHCRGSTGWIPPRRAAHCQAAASVTGVPACVLSLHRGDISGSAFQLQSSPAPGRCLGTIHQCSKGPFSV